LGLLARNSLILGGSNGGVVRIGVHGLKAWFPKLSVPQIQAIKLENRYNIDETGIMEGFGTNGLVVGRAGKRGIQKKQPGSRA
jgi:hypothetical protein